jgi:hypothetical protein
MFKADFVTFCHWRDYERLAAPGELKHRVSSHKYPFKDVIVVKQRLRDVPEARNVRFPDATVVLESEDYPDILKEYGLPEEDAQADEKTHGPSAPHYWKWHCINHLIGLRVATAEYVVFSDSDCRIQASPPSMSWVEAGMRVLSQQREVLIVAPSDGGNMAERRCKVGNIPLRLTQNVSQQMFMCERERLKGIDFNIPWNWEFTAPGGPFQEYYYMLEGRIWRYMHHNGLYRALLPDQWRYWHDAWH